MPTGPNVADLVEAMESLAPSHLAAAWDNVGLLVGDPAAALGRVLLAIDCTRAVLEEAIRLGCDTVVAYHPPIFRPEKRFVAGSIAYEAARAGLAVFSPHTALDAAPGGTNDVLADALGMTARAPLRPVAAGDARGFGRIGAVPALPGGGHVERLKAALGVGQVLFAWPPGLGAIARAAVCAGSGGDLLDDAIRGGAGVFVTGELRHHDTLRALAAGIGVVCTLHSVSERAALGALERALGDKLPGVEVRRSDADREPVAFG